ncbi:MAG: hypothetical protein F6K61_21455 [Sphaerospermopsis sp. SIO1G1]|nr:hypothetical protein [Sphaerospermopsis sp. SIO1G1]
MMDTESLIELYEALGVKTQQQALNAIADLKTINSSMKTDIFTFLNIDFGTPKADLKDLSLGEQFHYIGAILRKSRDSGMTIDDINLTKL